MDGRNRYSDEMKQKTVSGGIRRITELSGLDARATTRLRVLNCIREAGEVSRTDISAALRLSPATVTFVTSGLMSGALIEEVDAQENMDTARRGRPRIALRLTKGKFQVAGIKIARKSMSVLILDFDGTEVAKLDLPLPRPQMSPEELVRVIHSGVSQTCETAGQSVDSLAGISIGLAGQVDAAAGFVHWSSSLTERNVDLAPILAAQLPCPAFLENDANLVAKAEQLFGQAVGLNNFLVVTVEYGVGLGIVLDGNLYRGERGCGAEFGHTKVQLDGAPCQCGQNGCLEAYVGGYALLREAETSLGTGADFTVKALAELARDGNAKAQDVLSRSAQMFAMGLANLINLFDPECIILAGIEHRIAHLHTDEVMRLVAQSVVNVDAPFPEIRIHHWGDEMWARGAAAMGIEQVSALKVKELGKNAA